MQNMVVLLSLIPGILCAELMTPERFLKIVNSDGDQKELRQELSSIPRWKVAEGKVVMKLRDGSSFQEDCIQKAKTVLGSFIVFTMTSESNKEPAHAIVGFDEKASVVRLWSLNEKTLVEGIVVVHSVRKTIASTGSFGNGFMEIVALSYSDHESAERALILKSGELFATREVTLTQKE